MGLDFFRKAMALQKKYARPASASRTTCRPTARCSTRVGGVPQGAPLPVGLSIDGPREIHDRYRVTNRGATDLRQGLCGGDAAAPRRRAVQHADLREPLQRLAAARRLSLPAPRAGLDLPAVSSRSSKPKASRSPRRRPGTRRSCRRRHAAGRTRPPGLGGYAVSVDPDEYGTFLCRVWDEWLARDYGQGAGQLLRNAGRAAHGHAVAAVHPQRVLRQGRGVEHDGAVYACDHYVYPEYRLGACRTARSARWCSRRRR